MFFHIVSFRNKYERCQIVITLSPISQKDRSMFRMPHPFLHHLNACWVEMPHFYLSHKPTAFKLNKNTPKFISLHHFKLAISLSISDLRHNHTSELQSIPFVAQSFGLKYGSLGSGWLSEESIDVCYFIASAVRKIYVVIPRYRYG